MWPLQVLTAARGRKINDIHWNLAIKSIITKNDIRRIYVLLITITLSGMTITIFGQIIPINSRKDKHKFFEFNRLTNEWYSGYFFFYYKKIDQKKSIDILAELAYSIFQRRITTFIENLILFARILTRQKIQNISIQIRYSSSTHAIFKYNVSLIRD